MELNDKQMQIIETAEQLEQAVRLNADENKEAVIFNSISAFSNLYKARAAVYLVKENLEVVI